MSKKHLVLGIGSLVFIYTALNQIPMISKDLWHYIKDLSIIIGITLGILYLIYLYEK